MRHLLLTTALTLGVSLANAPEAAPVTAPAAAAPAPAAPATATPAAAPAAEQHDGKKHHHGKKHHAMTPEEMAKHCADEMAKVQAMVDAMPEGADKEMAKLNMAHAKLEHDAIMNAAMGSHHWRHKAACMRYLGKVKAKHHHGKMAHHHSGIAAPAGSHEATQAAAAQEAHEVASGNGKA